MRKRDFVAGVLTYAGLNSILQDLVGKERYIELVELYWWSPWISVPCAIVGLITAAILVNTGD